MAGFNSDPPQRKFRPGSPDFGTENQKPSQPYIVDLVTLEKLFLQTIPLELDINPDANWIAIASPGRNNPQYQYVGSEDTISFDISWYANDVGREDVLHKCKWLESLTKNDGYDNKPHHIKFIFGRLFRSSKFIVASASYKLSLFNRDFDMLPGLAIQSVTLKRISDQNITRNDILKIEI